MDIMEKELWDAFYGKTNNQERCSVLTEAELNKHNKGILNEGFMSDKDIHNQFSGFEVLDFSKEGEHSGYIELSFPNADEVDYDSSVITGYTIYEDGKVAFDNWLPDDVYNEVAEYVKQHHSEELDEGCGKKKAKKKLKEDYDENGNFKFSDAEIAQVGGRKGKSDKKYKIYQNGGGEIAITPHNLNGSWILMDDSNNFDEVFNTIQTDWEDANYILWDQELLNDSDVTSYYPFDSIEEEDYGTFVFDLSKYYVDDLDEGCGKNKLNEDVEVQPDLFDDEYDVTYEDGRRLYDSSEIKNFMKKFPTYELNGHKLDFLLPINMSDLRPFNSNKDETMLLYFPKSKDNVSEKELSEINSELYNTFGNDVYAVIGFDRKYPGIKFIEIRYLDKNNLNTKKKKTLKESDESDENPYAHLYDDYSREEILKILDKFKEEYNFLYKNRDQVAGFKDALDAYEVYIKNPEFKKILKPLILARMERGGDFFSSDREVAALMFALDSLGYLDRFDGITSSMGPVIKEFKA